MTIKLPSELDFLLRDVAFKAQIDINSIRMPGGSWQLDPGTRSTLIDAVSNEFASTGLLASDEPNARLAVGRGSGSTKPTTIRQRMKQ